MNGILVLSHSAQAARGIAEIASQMGGPDVPIAACGGTEDGGLGTSVTEVLAALEDLLSRRKGSGGTGPRERGARANGRRSGRAREQGDRRRPDPRGLHGGGRGAHGRLLEGLAAVVEEAAGLKKLP